MTVPQQTDRKVRFEPGFWADTLLHPRQGFGNLFENNTYSDLRIYQISAVAIHFNARFGFTFYNDT